MIIRKILKVMCISLLVLVLTFQSFPSSFTIANSNTQSSNNEVVLLIPGIMGVELYKEYYSNYLDMYIERLVWFTTSKSGREDLNYDLNPTLIPKLPLGWEGSRSDEELFGISNMYGGFETFFKEKGYKVHYFSYDWRDSSNDLVDQLK